MSGGQIPKPPMSDLPPDSGSVSLTPDPRPLTPNPFNNNDLRITTKHEP